MEKFVIAGLKTEYNVRGELLRERSKDYKADFDDSETQIRINVKEEFIKKKHEDLPHLTIDEHEYMWTCEAFYSEMLKHNGLMLHSSCVEKDGFAYLFSARSGTGKSTHTHLWLKNLDGTRIINDDKPALIYDDGKWYACGTPFSGKTDENIDVKIPVRAITFLHRSETNSVKRIPPFQAVTLLIEQTIKPADKTLAESMLDKVDKLLRDIPVFLLGCNMNDDAAIIAYNEIERLIKE